jgi:protein-S-isoprenylcysteine O-methyltransferase Ste14
VGFSAVTRTRSLLNEFGFIEFLRLVYSVAASLFFLIRVRPSFVSMNPVHWAVALITSFSAHFFIREGTNNNSILLFMADTFVISSIFLGVATVFVLGRSFGLFPALRQVKTKYVYRIIRHPMYLGAIFFKLGYVLKNPSIFNILLLMVIIVLYDKRARYEEDIMSHNNSYVEYLQQVKYRFIPGVY